MLPIQNYHSFNLLSVLLASPSEKRFHLRFRNWQIDVSRCERQGQFSGGLNFSTSEITSHWFRNSKKETFTSFYKGRLKKGYTTKQFDNMFAKAYNAMQLPLKGDVFHKDTGRVYSVVDSYRDSSIHRCMNRATGQMVDLMRYDLQTLTMTPLEWYNYQGMTGEARAYQKRTDKMAKTLISV